MPIEKNLLTILFRLPVWQSKQRFTSVVSRKEGFNYSMKPSLQVMQSGTFSGCELRQTGALGIGNNSLPSP
jgi:hypothetical protein